MILFDAAYEIFVEDKDLPHSIYELDGADKCAIEICSLSKTAGFTDTRLGYTVVPRRLVRDGMSLNAMWSRNRETRTNGISYILQKGAAAVFTPEGQAQIHENLRVYKVFNTAMVFDRSGACVAGYDKTHLFSPMGENDYYTSGDHLCTFSLDGIRCGLVICYVDSCRANRGDRVCKP